MKNLTEGVLSFIRVLVISDQLNTIRALSEVGE